MPAAAARSSSRAACFSERGRPAGLSPPPPEIAGVATPVQPQRPRVALAGGAFQPGRAFPAGLAALASQQFAQPAGGFRIARLRGGSQPGGRRLVAGAPEQIGDLPPGCHVAVRRRPLQPKARLRRTLRLRHQQFAQPGGGGQVARLGGEAESLPRRLRVGRQAIPFEQQFSERALRRSRAAVGDPPAGAGISGGIGRGRLGRNADGNLERRFDTVAGQRQPVESGRRAGGQPLAAGKIEPAQLQPCRGVARPCRLDERLRPA